VPLCEGSEDRREQRSRLRWPAGFTDEEGERNRGPQFVRSRVLPARQLDRPAQMMRRLVVVRGTAGDE